MNDAPIPSPASPADAGTRDDVDGLDPPVESPTLADDRDVGHGRVGYGRFGKYTPLALGILLILLLIAIAAIERSRPGEAERETGNISGKMVPDVTLTLLDGTPLRLQDLRGEVVVLNFWASWCGPCKQEAPMLESFSREVAASGEQTAVVGVGIRTDHDADARAFVQDQGLTYPIGRDNQTDQPGVGPIEAAFGIPDAYPSTLFIRPDGVVDRFHLGPISEAQLRYGVDEARAASLAS